jgi:hypothetical protein
VIGFAVLLVNVSFIVALDPVCDGGVILVTLALLQANVVPVVAEVPVKETKPEQLDEVVLGTCNFGLGFTVTLTVSGLEQPLALSVKIYRTTIGAEVLFRKVSVIVFPFPGVAVVVIPVTAGRVHENKVPAVALVAA